MKSSRRVTLAAALLLPLALSLALATRASAQPGGFGGIDLSNIDPQQIQNLRQQFQNMDPGQLQQMVQQFQNLDPQSMQATAQQFLNMDPSQIPQALAQRSGAALRTEFGITDDAMWARIDEKIKAVTKARAAVTADTTVALITGALRSGRGGGGGAAAAAGRMTPEAQALQTTLNEKAPLDKIKEALARLRAVRDANQAALRQAREDLRALLTVRQEAVAIAADLLD